MAKKSASRSRSKSASKPSAGAGSHVGEAVPTAGQEGPGDVRRQLPTDVARPSATDDNTGSTGDDRPTAREGLRPVGLERPHPTAAARPAKTAGEAERRIMNNARLAEVGDPNRVDDREPSPMRVEATQMGYYDNIRRRTGDVFDIRFKEDYSARWMRPVDGSTPPKVTRANEAIRARNLEERNRAAERGAAARGEAPRRTREDNPLNA